MAPTFVRAALSVPLRQFVVQVRSRLYVAVFTAVAVACTKPATEVIVSIDTDMPGERPMTITARIVTSADASGSQTWVRGDGLDGGITLPATFGLVPGASDSRDMATTLIVDATLGAGASSAPPLSIRRVARFSFTPETTTQLPLFLSMSCAGAAQGCTSVPDDQCSVSVWCEDHGATCGDRGTCVSLPVTPVVPADAADVVQDATQPPDDVPQPVSVGYCLSMPSLVAPPRIDGLLDQPLQLQPLPLSLTTEGDSGQVTAEAAIAWRRDGLYFYIRVHEQTRTPAPANATLSQYWCGDAVEVFVDPVTTGLNTPFRASTRQFLIPAPADSSTPARRVSRRRIPVQNEDWTGSFGAFPTRDGYVTEAFVSAADLDVPGLSLGAATGVAIDIQVDIGGPAGSRGGGSVCDDHSIRRFAQLTLHNNATCIAPCNPSQWQGAYCTPALVPP